MITALPSIGARLLRVLVIGWALIGGSVAVIKVGQGAPLPSSGGAAGLPWKSGGLFTPNAGALAAYRAANSARFMDSQTSALGFVITPKTSIADAIASVSGTIAGSSGGRILLTEGTWDFPTGGITIAGDNIEIVALSPGNTFFRSRSATQSIVTITGDYVRIQGVTFVDQVHTYPAVHVRGNYATIQDCVFLEGLGVAIEPVGSGRCDGVAVRDCLFGLASTGSITLTGNCDICQVEGNRFLATGYISVNSPLVTNTLITGNSLASPGAIYYPFGYGTVAKANSAILIQPSATLADNTANADVSVNFYWPVATTYGVSIDFALYRGATPDIETGRLELVINSAECLVYMDAVTTTVNPGVTFSGVVVAGVAYLQYTTTATGSAATLKLTVTQERLY